MLPLDPTEIAKLAGKYSNRGTIEDTKIDKLIMPDSVDVKEAATRVRDTVLGLENLDVLNCSDGAKQWNGWNIWNGWNQLHEVRGG